MLGMICLSFFHSASSALKAVIYWTRSWNGCNSNNLLISSSKVLKAMYRFLEAMVSFLISPRDWNWGPLGRGGDYVFIIFQLIIKLYILAFTGVPIIIVVNRWPTT